MFVFQTLIHQQYFTRVYTVGMCVKSTIIAFAYKKVSIFLYCIFHQNTHSIAREITSFNLFCIHIFSKYSLSLGVKGLKENIFL